MHKIHVIPHVIGVNYMLQLYLINEKYGSIEHLHVVKKKLSGRSVFKGVDD